MMIMEKTFDKYFVHCQKCGSRGRKEWTEPHTYQAAATAWNKREARETVISVGYYKIGTNEKDEL